MKKKFFVIIGIVLVASIAFFGFYFVGGDGSENGQLEEEAVTDGPGGDAGEQIADREFADISLNLYNKDKTVQLKLVSKDVRQYEKDNLLELSPVEIRAYKIDGQSKKTTKSNLLYICRAEKGNYSGKKGVLNISGSVTIKRNNTVFSFQTMTWNQAKDKISAEGNVLLENDEIAVRGEKFTTNSAFDHLVFYGNEEKKASLNWKGMDDVR